MNIDLTQYELYQPDDIKIIKSKLKTIDIKVEDDNTFYLVGDNGLLLSHNCDGNHIKGLVLNIFDSYWPELLDIPFIYEFVTPIVKVSKGKEVKYFYRLNEYQKWKESNPKGYQIKYFKGLGTLEPYEAKMFFKNINKHLIRFNQTESETTKDLIDLAFNKKRTDDRKEWLLGYEPVEIIDKFSTKQTYESFFNNEFIEFSMYDNVRSIPSVMDGFKPSQRKIMYTMFKNNYKDDIKVSNFSGAVIQATSYHHGNSSIEGTTVGLAQNFVGSNNINLLEPKGQFGTRICGGSDAASSRYIFTKLSPVTRYLYKEVDDHILHYLNDDGTLIEPEFYTPIIPMCLINGAEGIGTGWSTFIPKFNPKDITKYLANKLGGKSTKIDIKPYYKGFKGEIVFDSEFNRYITKGVIHKVNMSTLKITELPIGMWNDKYYDILDKMIEKNIIKDYSKNDTDIDVDITINITREKLKDIEDNKEDLVNIFSLESYLSMGNLILWNANGKIKKYESVYEVIDDFYSVRLDYYGKRKDYILEKLEKEKKIILNRMKFINAILKGTLKINNVKKDVIEEELIKMEIDKVDDSFNYLLNMPLISLTNEKLMELKESSEKKKEEIKTISGITLPEMWLEDLKELVPFIKNI